MIGLCLTVGYSGDGSDCTPAPSFKMFNSCVCASCLRVWTVVGLKDEGDSFGSGNDSVIHFVLIIDTQSSTPNPHSIHNYYCIYLKLMLLPLHLMLYFDVQYVFIWICQYLDDFPTCLNFINRNLDSIQKWSYGYCFHTITLCKITKKIDGHVLT